MSQGKKCLKKTKELQFFLKDKLHGIVTDLKKDTTISTVNHPISTVNHPISPRFVKRLVSFVYFVFFLQQPLLIFVIANFSAVAQLHLGAKYSIL